MLNAVDSKDTEQNISTLGAMIWLLMHSELHKRVTTRVLMRNTLPPIALRQFKIIYAQGYPVAYASWAGFSQASEKKYINEPMLLDPKDWNSGDRMWFIDYVSPFSYHHTLQLRSWLRTYFHGRYVRALRVRPGNPVGKIHTFAGRGLPENWKEGADQEIFKNFIAPSNEHQN